MPSVLHEPAATLTSRDGTTIGYRTLGSGEALIVVGGVLRSARDYLGLGRALAGSFAVHVMDRRGRGASGPQGPGYAIETECEDLLALQAATGAERVFGHSYGAFVALQTARRTAAFRQVAVYEPVLAIGGSPPLDWLARYRERLDAGDPRGAFAAMVTEGGFAPRALTAMPPWCIRLLLRLGIRGREWQRTEALLDATFAEHRTLLEHGGLDGYSEIAADTLLIGGARSPAFVARGLRELHGAIPSSALAILDGLDHLAPETHPDRVADHLRWFFAGAPARPPMPAGA